MQRYLLPRNTYVAFLHDGVVFLDLKRDLYRGVGSDEAGTLTEALHRCSTGELRAGDIDVCEQLVKERLLTCDEKMGKPVTSLDIQMPARALINDGAGPPIRIRPRHMLHLLIAILKSIAKLKWGVIHAVKRPTKPGPTLGSRSELHALVRIFRELTPFFYVAHEHCLFNAVVLREFLRRQRIDSQLVIGVRVGPFAAHCWLQSGDDVLTDRAEYITGFAPIVAT